MIDPKKLALPIQPIESHKLDLSDRKPKPVKPPTSRLVVDARVTPAVARLHWTDAAGGCWVDPDSRPRHRGKPMTVGSYSDDPAKIARTVIYGVLVEKPKRKRGK